MQTRAMIMKPIVLVPLLIALGVADVVAQNYDDITQNITSRTDDFATESERQMRAIIELSNDELEAYKANYANQVDVIDTQKTLLETNLMNYQQRLIALEIRDDLSKYCVQKYKMRLTTVSAVTSRITNCASSAKGSYATIVTAPTATIASMNSYINVDFKALKDNCVKLYAKFPSNYTLCITQAVNQAQYKIDSFRKTFNTQMQASSCTGDGRVEQAVDCSFMQVYSVTYQYGEVMNSINNCIDGKEFCPPCNTTEETPSCGNQLYIQDSPDLFTNTTIINPFRGWQIDLNSTNTSPDNSTKCVEVHITSIAP